MYNNQSMNELFWTNRFIEKFKFLSKVKLKVRKISNFFFLRVSSGNQLKIHNYITQEERKRYETNPIFSAVYFELRSRCNSTCSFCAASIQNETRPDITMSFLLFKKSINELSEINYNGKIAFHVNSDPLLIKNIAEFVGYARQKCPNAWIQILSNGKSLNNKNGQELIDAGVNEISLNIYSKNKKLITPKNVKKFEDEVLLKNYSINKIQSGHVVKNKMADNIYYNKSSRILEEQLTNRAGSAPNKKTNQKLPTLGFCSYPFEQFNIDASGNVSHCCADFYFSNKMGNIRDNSMLNIWEGEGFKKVRQHLLNNERASGSLCSKCDHFGITKVPKKFFRRNLYKLARI